MKTIRNKYSILALAFLTVACNTELNPDDIQKANPGDEVQFSAKLPGSSTKTAYGKEDNNAFPIYWVNEDKVQIASPQCQLRRNNARYQISAEGTTQNYANSIDKTGDTGIQWGTDAADFYSIYPSNDITSIEISGNSVIAHLHIDATQVAKYNATTKCLEPEDMQNSVMYAKTTNVTPGATVNLQYAPFSSVIEFEIAGPNSGTAGYAEEVIVQTLTLTAPSGKYIAGDFTADLGNATSTSNLSTVSGVSLASYSNASGSITLHLLDENSAYVTIGKSNSIKAKLCLMPQEYETLEGWTIKVDCTVGSFSKTITSSDYENMTEGKSKNLAAGMVHKVKLPALNYKGEWTYDLDNWIPSLPDYTNIYLSEISLPGAWYAGSSEAYQATSDIAALWNAGVRAFAVETRTTATNVETNFLGVTTYTGQDEPNGLILSGTGNNSTNSYASGTNTLNTTATSSSKAYLECSNRYTASGYKLSSIIDDIAVCVKDDEYGVLVISYADGGEGGHRYIDHGAWLHMIYEAFNNCTKKDKIYQNAITANTTVNDVLGKLILKINVDADIAMGGTVNSTSYTYEGKSLPALFSYNPFPLQITGNSNTDLNGISVPYFSSLYWSEWGDDVTNHRNYFRAATAQTMENPFVWCFSSANRTDCTNTTSEDGTVTNTEVATLSQRKAALKAMGNYSKQIYENSTHNVWFYYNCGGTHATVKEGGDPSPTSFASAMNNWLLNRIKMKCGEVANDNGELKPEPSPLGIVMFNQCTGDNYYGADIIKYIIEMNSKFYLKHASSSGSAGGSVEQTAQNDGTLQNGPDAI